MHETKRLFFFIELIPLNKIYNAKSRKSIKRMYKIHIGLKYSFFFLLPFFISSYALKELFHLTCLSAEFPWSCISSFLIPKNLKVQPHSACYSAFRTARFVKLELLVLPKLVYQRRTVDETSGGLRFTCPMSRETINTSSVRCSPTVDPPASRETVR